MMRLKVFFTCFVFVLLISCNRKEARVDTQRHHRTNIDSMMIETLMAKQEFALAIIKIDSILPLKPVGQRGFYYYKRGFNSLMLEHHVEAISNFEQSILLGYKVKASTAMLQTAKTMKDTYKKYAK